MSMSPSPLPSTILPPNLNGLDHLATAAFESSPTVQKTTEAAVSNLRAQAESSSSTASNGSSPHALSEEFVEFSMLMRKDLYLEEMVPFFHNKKRSLESSTKRLEQSIREKERELKLFQQQMEAIQIQLKNHSCSLDIENQELSRLQKKLELFENLCESLPSASPSKQAHIAASPPDQNPFLDSRDRLLAEIYHPKNEYYGTLYFQNVETVAVKIQELAASNKFSLIALETSEKFTAGYQDLFFIPQPNHTFLFKDKAAFHYYPAQVHKVNPLYLNDQRFSNKRASCSIIPLKDTRESVRLRYIAELNDILPFGPDHPNAELLDRDEQGGYYLREKAPSESPPSSSSKRARSS